MDYRLKENRRESFIKWYAWSLKFGDCDPAIWMTNYLNERYELMDEQRIWLSWLYGNTYNLPTSWVIINEFPDFELATVHRMNNWNTENYKRLRYQVDTKWNKGHIPVMFESYGKFIGNKTQREVLESYYGENEKENFDNLWNVINNKWYKFGRYMTWFYLQHLKHTCNFKIEPNSLVLEDFKGSKSHRNGLLLALGKDDLYDVQLTKDEYSYLEKESLDIISEMKNRFPELDSKIDLFSMETVLCSYKKIFRENNGRYLGYYLDRQSEEIIKAEGDYWYGIDWNVLWQARSEILDSRLSGRSSIDIKKYSYFIKTGKFDRLEWIFPEDNILIGLDNFI